MTEKVNYDQWISKPSVKKDFEKDLRKRKGIIFVVILFSLSFIFFITGLILISNKILKELSITLFVLAGLFFLIFFILSIFCTKFILNKKNFIVYLLYVLANKIFEGTERDNEKKELKKLIKILKRLFHQREVEEGYDPFYYEKISSLKRELRELAIYLENKLNQNQIGDMSNILHNLSKRIYNEEIIENFLAPIIKTHGGDIEEKKKRIKINSKYILAIIIAVIILIIGYFFNIPKETLFYVIVAEGGLVIIAELIRKKR